MQRIECACSTCRANNGGEPLAALIPDALYLELDGIHHGTVWSAHEPGAIGEAVRRATGVKAVQAVES